MGDNVQKKQKVDMIIALILILIGAILLVLPLFKITNVKWLMMGVFSLYIILNIIQFILTKDSKDYEGIHSAFASLVALIVILVFDIESKPKYLAMVLMLWIGLMAITKLKKADYYHDRQNRMWKYRIFNLILFILVGLLTSINLAYSSSVQILIIGFFMLTHGILELFDPVTIYLLAE